MAREEVAVIWGLRCHFGGPPSAGARRARGSIRSPASVRRNPGPREASNRRTHGSRAPPLRRRTPARRGAFPCRSAPTSA